MKFSKICYSNQKTTNKVLYSTKIQGFSRLLLSPVYEFVWAIFAPDLKRVKEVQRAYRSQKVEKRLETPLVMIKANRVVTEASAYLRALDDKDKDILKLLFEDLSSTEIAQRVGLSQKDVESRIEKITHLR